MNVWFVMMDEVFFLPPYLDQTIAKLPEDISVVGITPVSEFESISDLLATFRERAEMFGFSSAILLAALTVVFRLAGKVLPGGSLAGRPFTVRAVAAKHNIPCVETDDVNSYAFATRIRESDVDVVVSSNPVIFEQELLNAPNIGCINRHTSYLPYNRGLYPVYWALAQRQDSVGASIHWMTDEIDEGDIIDRTKIPIAPKDSLVSLYMKGYDLSADLTMSALRSIASGTVNEIPNNGGSYHSTPDSNTVQQFHAQSHPTIRLSDIPKLLTWRPRK